MEFLATYQSHFTIVFLCLYCLLITVGIEKLTYKTQLTLLTILISANIFCAFII